MEPSQLLYQDMPHRLIPPSNPGTFGSFPIIPPNQHHSSLLRRYGMQWSYATDKDIRLSQRLVDGDTIAAVAAALEDIHMADSVVFSMTSCHVDSTLFEVYLIPALSQIKRFKTITISDCIFTDPAIAFRALSKLLESSKTEALFLSEVGYSFTQECRSEIAKCIVNQGEMWRLSVMPGMSTVSFMNIAENISKGHLPKLRHLALCSNKLTCEDDLNALVKAISNSRLEDLNLHNCDLDSDAAAAIVSALPSTIEWLTMSNNPRMFRTGKVIDAMLSSLPKTKIISLILDVCSITQEIMHKLTVVVRDCLYLRSVDLDANHLSVDCIGKFIKGTGWHPRLQTVVVGFGRIPFEDYEHIFRHLHVINCRRSRTMTELLCYKRFSHRFPTVKFGMLPIDMFRYLCNMLWDTMLEPGEYTSDYAEDGEDDYELEDYESEEELFPPNDDMVMIEDD